MKNKFFLVAILLALALIVAACAAQQATDRPAEDTETLAVSTEASTATEEAAEVATTPTGAVEAGTPAEGTEESTATAAVSAGGATSAPEAGGTAGIPQTGPGSAGLPDNLQEMIRVLQTAGVTVEVGDEVEQEAVTAIGRIVTIDGEEVRFFTYPSAEELEVQIAQLANQGDPEREPRFYKLGNMLVFYAGRDSGVRDLLEDVLGAQEAAQ